MRQTKELETELDICNKDSLSAIERHLASTDEPRTLCLTFPASLSAPKMFLYISKSLACFALQTETIVPKTKNELFKICNEPGIRAQILRFYGFLK